MVHAEPDFKGMKLHFDTDLWRRKMLSSQICVNYCIIQSRNYFPMMKQLSLRIKFEGDFIFTKMVQRLAPIYALKHFFRFMFWCCSCNYLGLIWFIYLSVRAKFFPAFGCLAQLFASQARKFEAKFTFAHDYIHGVSSRNFVCKLRIVDGVIGARATHSLDSACEINSTSGCCVGEFASARPGMALILEFSLARLREKLSRRANDKIHLFAAVTTTERNLSFTFAKYLCVLLNFKQLGQSFAKVATET